MTILVLKTDLFPDAARVEEALETLRETHEVTQTDVSGLSPEDDNAWATVTRQILAADSVVTL